MGRASVHNQISWLLDLIYPPCCLHCSSLTQDKKALCKECLEHLVLLPLQGRCTKCFSSISAMSGVCKPCRKISHPFRRLGACFDGYGPARSLSQAYHSGLGQFSKELAAYIVVQLNSLSYPHFDTITSVPRYFTEPLASIGNELAQLLGCSYRPVLKRRFEAKARFELKNRCSIINQKVLLLDMYLEDPQIMRAAGWGLDEGRPRMICGMAICGGL